MAGDFEAAGKHAAQFAMDLPAGWIDKRLSLSNALFDTGDITDEDEKYEFSDLLEQWGMPAPREGTWSRTGVDILGGIIDPLTFIGGPLAGMGRKALVGAGTTVGREILEASLKSGRSGFSKLLKSPQQWDALKARDPVAAAARLDEIVFDYLPAKAQGRPGVSRGNIEWENLAEDELEDVVRGLRKDMHVDTPSISSVGIPFGPHKAFGTGAGEKFFEKFPAMEMLWRYKDHAIGSLWDRTFKYAHMLPPGFRSVVNKAIGDRTARDSFARDNIYKTYATDPISVNARNAPGSTPSTWDLIDDDELKNALNFYVPLGTKESPTTQATLVETLLKNVDGIDNSTVPVVASELRGILKEELKDQLRSGNIVSRGAAGDAVTLDFDALTQRVLSNYNLNYAAPALSGQAKPFRVFADLDPPGGKKWASTLKNPQHANFDAQAENWAEFVLRGVSGQIQAREIVSKLSAAGTDAAWQVGQAKRLQPALDKALREGDFGDYAKGVQGIWEQAIDAPMNVPGSDYSWLVDKKGKNANISHPDLYVPGEAGMTVPEIAHQRLLKASARVAHNYSKELSRKLVPSLGIDTRVFDDYMDHVFGEVAPDRGLIRKLLAGGEISDELVPASQAKNAVLGTKQGAFSAVKTYRTKEGLLRRKTVWGGVNRMWKPLLTSAPTNVDYHFRNTLSSVFMLATDPNVGWTGVEAALKMPAMMLGFKNKNMEAYLKALHTDPRKSVEGMKALGGLSGTVGKTGLTHKQFIEAARTFLGGGKSHDTADLMRELGDTMALLQHHTGKKVPERMATAFARAGENMSNWVENQMRLHSFQKNLEAGLTVTDAAKATQRTLVDYSVQSKFDRMVRDIFPFIRFRIGSMAWTGAVMTRPRNLGQIAQLHRSSEERQAVADPNRPRGEWDNLNISLPGIPGIFPEGVEIAPGIGAQSTLENFGILLGGVSLGNYGNFKQIMTEAHPVFRVLLDATYGKELYSGKPFASDVRAEGYQKLLPGVTMGKSRWGVEREEINGVVKALLDNSPISRQLRLVNKAFSVAEGEIGAGEAIFRQTTGIRAVQKDELRDLKNKLAALIKMKIDDGSIYEYLMPLSSRSPEDTPPEIKLLLEQMKNVRGRIRDRRKSETPADLGLGLATGGRGF